MSLRQVLRPKFAAAWIHQILVRGTANKGPDMIDLPDNENAILPIPSYEDKIDEPFDQKKARLLYQSRKRGMLENGLLLSSFAAKYLPTMSTQLTQQYDRLINLPSNDWDIYYWATERTETPVEFDNEIMRMLKEHVQNKGRESRIRQPDLYDSEPAEDLYRNTLDVCK